MAPERKQRNFKKRLNYVAAVALLIVFYVWLGHYAYSPAGSGSGAPYGESTGDRITPRSHGLVAGFRKDIPIFTPTRVRTCHVADPTSRVSATLQTPVSLEAVARFYRTALVKNGWKTREKRFAQNGDAASTQVVFRGEKENHLLDVGLTRNGSFTEIRLQLLPGPLPVVHKSSS